MAGIQPSYIFHLYRSNGTATFLHPFLSRENILKTLENGTVAGLYGAEPEMAALGVLRRELYRLVDSSVRQWINDVRFIPRFLLSAAVFVLLYLFLSFAVRDPVPLIDEFALSFSGAFLTYALVGRRNVFSVPAEQKRVALKRKVDAIVFTQSQFVQDVEELLGEMEDEDEEFVLTEAVEGRIGRIDVSRHEAQELCRYLGVHYERKGYRRLEKYLLRLTAPEGRTDLSTETTVRPEFEVLQSRLAAGKVDVPLYALYLRLKHVRVKSR